MSMSSGQASTTCRASFIVVALSMPSSCTAPAVIQFDTPEHHARHENQTPPLAQVEESTRVPIKGSS